MVGEGSGSGPPIVEDRLRQAAGLVLGDVLARVADPDADDLALVVRYEQNEPSQPLIEALLELRSGDAPVGVREAADRLVRDRAPWALAVDASLSALLEAAGDKRTRDLFAAWSSWQEPHSLQQLARHASISPQRTARIVYRADSRVRAVLAASRGPVPWMVSALGRRLGPAATEDQVLATLARFGVAQGHADLAVWLAGPYRAVLPYPGWLALDPQGLVARTSACLAADGGVRRLVDVTAELGLPTDRVASWLRASGAVVVHDLSVSTLGKLVDVVERVLDAHGRPVTPSDIAACLEGGVRAVTEAQLASTLRGRRFRRSGDGAVGLADWNDAPATPTCSRGSAAGSLARRATGSPVPTRVEDVDPPRGDERLWLWVRVDSEVLRGDEAVVPAALVDGLGIAAETRRTFASQYGPIVLAHEGAQPVRGSARAVVLAAGARDGDTLLMGFSARGDFLVEVRRAAFQAGEADPSDTEFTLFPESFSGGAP